MSRMLMQARRAAMGVPEKEILAFKGGDSANWLHLEDGVRAAVGGYHAVVDGGSLADIMARVETVPEPLSGYAHEGVAMGLTGLDCVLPWKSRFRAFLAGPGDAHVYMVHIGAGEALARMRRRPEPFLAQLDDPVLRWLVMDGYGFHQGFFARKKFVDRQIVPEFLSPYARRVFDQGVGRSIWFSSGADVSSIAARIAAFTPDRHADLWLGVGVACSYVGGVSRQEIELLREVCAPHLTRVATGAAFAARGRHRAGNPQADTDLACEVLCGTDSLGASKIVENAFASLPTHMVRPGYELLQLHLFEAFAMSRVPA
ncbi:DUF1702 family protein [Antrihabitans spumae]|uniref:DUF1702 family protein n=1 Tax=Antrihabitans spumae TaxID=3373370 RepID=A0ABW7JPU6_9NOCA